MTKMDTIFLTRLNWEQLGGLPGMILTVTDVGMAKLRLCGPPLLSQFVEATRFFIARNDLALHLREFHGVDTQDVFQDENITVVPIVVYAQGHSAPTSSGLSVTEPAAIRGRVACQIENNHGRPHDYTVHLRTQYVPSKHAMSVEAHPADPPAALPSSQAQSAPQPRPKTPRRMKEFHKHLPWHHIIDATVCYAVHTPDIPGKFDAKMADKLGVKPNMRSKLVKGETVTVEGGRVVSPSECISPATPGSIFIVVHCPTEAHIHSLTQDNSRAWIHYHSNAATKVVVHITPRHVLTSSAYKEWMAKFDPAVQHIVLNQDHCAQDIVFQSSAVNLHKLSLLDRDVFRTPFSYDQPRASLNQDFEGLDFKIVAGRPLDLFHLAPLNMLGLDTSESIKPMQPAIDEALAKLLDPSQNADFMEKFELLKKVSLIDATTAGVSNTSCGFEVVFLGTGAALPSKYRNVSSTYLHIDGQGGLLFDAGEGTYGQLFRRYGSSELQSVIRQLRCVFVSHMHADHHLGLIRILAERVKLGKEGSIDPLLIIGPTAYHFWLKEYCNQIEALQHSFWFADCFDFWQENHDASVEAKKHLQVHLGIEEIQICNVVHCPDAFAISVKHSTGWKVVFSGDTRPCPQLDRIGQDCTVLIHEATFEDNLSTEAVEKRHSTTTEAIQSAINMNAKFLLMNHFSQRYPKIPVFDSKYNNRTGVTFDLMSVRPEMFHKLPSFLPSLSHMFVAEADADAEDAVPPTEQKALQERAAKRAKTKE